MGYRDDRLFGRKYVSFRDAYKGQKDYEPDKPKGEHSGPRPGAKLPSQSRESFWKPLITIIIAVVIIIVGYAVIKKLTKKEEQPEVNQKERTFGGVDSGKSAGVFYESEEANNELKNAENYYKDNPTKFSHAVELYERIIKNFPDTKASKKAEQRCEEIRKLWSEVSNQDFEKTKAEANAHIEKHHYGDALKVCENFLSTKRPPEYTTKTNDLIKNINVSLKKYIGEIKNEATDAEKKDLNLALKIYEKLRETGIEEHIKYADEKIKILTQKIFDLRWEHLDKLFIYVAELKEKASKKYEYDAAVNMLEDKFRRDSRFSAISYEVNRELAFFRGAKETIDRFFKGIGKMKGEKVNIQFRTAKMSNCEFVGVKEGNKITIKTSGDFLQDYPLEKFSPKQIVEVAERTIDISTPDAYAKLGAFCYLNDLLNEADTYIKRAEEYGWDVSIYLEKVESDKVLTRITEWKEYNLVAAHIDWHQEGSWRADPDAKGVRGKEKSIMYLKKPPEKPYVVEIKAKKESGLNGFIIHFSAFGRFFTWEIGTEGNSKSIVLGVPKTITNDNIQQERWYLIKVVVFGDEVIGFIDDQRKWRFKKDDVKQFLEPKGVGVGTHFTEVLFTEYRINILK